MTDFRIDLTALQDDDIAASTLSTAISPGTEIAAFVGAPPLRPGPVYPRLVGYCNIAEVVAVGRSVVGIKAGDRIATHQSHRSAFVCAASDVLAVLPDDVDSGLAATTYLFHLGYTAVLRADAKVGDNLAVIGLGTLGLTTAAVGAMAGMSVVGLSNQNIHDAAAFGIEEVIPKTQAAFERPGNRFSKAAPIDLVVSTSNDWPDWLLALQIARFGGSVAVTGFPGRGLPNPDFNPLDSQYFYDKQLTIYASGYVPDLDVLPQDIRHTLKRNFQFLLGAIARGALPAAQLISERTHSKNLGAVYERLAGREPELRTAILEWK